jgi:hypothetical protein
MYASLAHKLYSQTPELRVTGLEPFEFTLVQVLLRTQPCTILQRIYQYCDQHFSTPATVRRMSPCVCVIAIDSI